MIPASTCGLRAEECRRVLPKNLMKQTEPENLVGRRVVIEAINGNLPGAVGLLL